MGYVDDATITTFLSDLIGWYRHQGTEAQVVDHPEEVLFFTTDQQIAREVLNLGFQAARAQAALNAKANPSSLESDSSRTSIMPELSSKLAEVNADVARVQKRIADLQAQLAAPPKGQRAALSAQLNSARAELTLAHGRADSIKSMLEYANGLAVADHKSTGISAQIDELQQTIPDNEKAAKPPESLAGAAAKKQAHEVNGIIELAAAYFELRGDSQMLRDSNLRVLDLGNKIDKFRAPALKLTTAISDRSAQLAALAVPTDPAEIEKRTSEYKQLIDLHNPAVEVLAPLRKQEVQLALYRENLTRWQASIDRYSSGILRGLLFRLATLFGTLAILVLGNYLWRWSSERYIHDPRRRYQLQQLSQPIFWALIAFVLIVNFATELGSIATIMGFAAAGIALALQNVILSVAGYFFLIGKFGIRVGDRVQIGNTTGDVINLGLVKLTLMELSPQDRQPTGRVVVYSNAVVFQPNGNFFKQAPGMSFVWNEVRLTLAPDCDYRLAEKRIVDATDEVFARYRDRVQRDFRYLEADLHILLETPRPQSRLQLTSAGLDMIVRYPADVRTATQIADEVSRRVLDAIKREPGLKLVTPGTANIQHIELPPAAEDAATEEAPAAGNGEPKAMEKS